MNHSDQLKIAVSFRGIPVTKSLPKFLGRVPAARPMATALASPKTEGFSLNRNIFVSPSAASPREVTAHEWLHTVPGLGHSETAARFYGGYAAPRGAGLMDRLRGGLQSTRDYYTQDYAAYHPTLSRFNPFLKNRPKPSLRGLDRDDTDILNTHASDLRR